MSNAARGLIGASFWEWPEPPSRLFARAAAPRWIALPTRRWRQHADRLEQGPCGLGLHAQGVEAGDDTVVRSLVVGRECQRDPELLERSRVQALLLQDRGSGQSDDRHVKPGGFDGLVPAA